VKFVEISKLFSLNKSTYINLRWIAYIGQIITILLVEFYFSFNFDYYLCTIIIFLSILSNIYLQFKIKENQINNLTSSIYLGFDILQLGTLLYLTGGITNPFIVLIIVPAIFSSQYLKIKSSIFLVILTILTLIVLTFYYEELPSPGNLHFHAPDYYLNTVPLSIIIGLIFLVYYGVKFGEENRFRKQAYDQIQEIMAKENELLSLGGQAAAAAHSLGTPLSTILLTAKELQKEYINNKKITKDLDLLVSQSNRCSEILKKLTLNPNIDDKFISSNISINDYIQEIVFSFKEISKKNFLVNLDQFKKKIKINKSAEVVYGLRNFIGNANKFSKNKIEISLISNENETIVIIKDDGPGFPKDLIDKHKLGEPYIRSKNEQEISKYGFGLGTFIGKTLLEKNYASINFENRKEKGDATVIIKWKNKDLKNI
tara:strand:- start:186 stop:1472 length:1287 start_codon:yes stop_codon:yes gene_type:complete